MFAEKSNIIKHYSSHIFNLKYLCDYNYDLKYTVYKQTLTQIYKSRFDIVSTSFE